MPEECPLPSSHAFRSLPGIWLSALLYSVVALLLAHFAYNNALYYRHGSVIASVGATVLAAVLVWAAVTQCRMGIFTTSQVVVVRGWRTRDVPWGDIAEFCFRSASAANSGAYLAVRTSGGQVYKTAGFVARRGGTFAAKAQADLEGQQKFYLLRGTGGTDGATDAATLTDPARWIEAKP